MYENNISSSNVICALLLLFEMRNLSTHIRALAQPQYIHTLAAMCQRKRCKRMIVRRIMFKRCAVAALRCVCVLCSYDRTYGIYYCFIVVVAFSSHSTFPHTAPKTTWMYLREHIGVYCRELIHRKEKEVSTVILLFVCEQADHRIECYKSEFFSPRVDSCVQKPSHRRSFYLCSVRLSLSYARRL